MGKRSCCVFLPFDRIKFLFFKIICYSTAVALSLIWCHCVFFFFRWNFSVGQHDVSFLEALSKESDNGHCSVHDEEVFADWSLRVSIPNGLVAAMGSRGSKQAEMVLWSHQFDSPIAAVWRLNRGFIQQVSVLSEEVMPELADSTSSKMFPQGPVMYIGDFTISFLSLK